MGIISAAAISPLSDLLRFWSLVLCKSYNEELIHWNTALALRESHYFINTPFVIPKATELPQTQSTEQAPRESLPSSVRHARKRRTPDCQEQISSKLQPVSSPEYASFSGVSDVNRFSQPKSLVKLRHPSKLHKGDLTINTLKIYLKHYMDDHTHGNGGYMTSGSSAASLDMPTRGRRSSTGALMPRPTFENRAIVVPPSHLIQKPRKRRKIDPEAGICGLTMSYLRRVPELRLLAEMIAAAEDEKKRQKQAREEATSQGLLVPPKAESTKPRTSTRERTKRLFRLAIIKLCDEGSIVLWDGPRRVWDAEQDSNTSRLWHTNTTVNTTASSVGASTAGGCSYLEDLQDHEMSEPDPREESYVSLTPAHLGKYVEKAIEEICSRNEKARGSGRQGSKGPTLTEIRSRLGADGRWRSIGECVVAEALQWLKDEDRVWEVGGGRWELTI